MAESADSGLCDHFGGVHNVGGGRTLDNWTFLKKIIFQFFATNFSSKSFSITLHRKCTRNQGKCISPWFCTACAREKKSVFCKYLRNEMRYAKMKSFRLNGILRRILEQSFEEIGEPLVVVGYDFCGIKRYDFFRKRYDFCSKRYDFFKKKVWLFSKRYDFYRFQKVWLLSSVGNTVPHL